MKIESTRTITFTMTADDVEMRALIEALKAHVNAQATKSPLRDRLLMEMEEVYNEAHE